MAVIEMKLIHFIWPKAGLAIDGTDVKHDGGRATLVATETTCRECLIRLARCGEWPGAAARVKDGHYYKEGCQ